ncbi:MAG: S8 family serine peptidase [Chloroflexota bacterium]
MSGSRRPLGRPTRTARRIAGLLLAALAALPVVAVPGVAAGSPGAAGLAGAVRVADPGRERPFGFWLGPSDDVATRDAAVAASGLPIGADGQPVVASLADARTLRHALLDAHAGVDGVLSARFLAAAAALGVRDATALTTAPLVMASVTPAQRRALAALDVVERVEPAGGPVRLQMASAYPTIGAPAAYAAGFRGNGVRIGVVEYADIDFGLPLLKDVPHQQLRVARSGGSLVCRSGRPLHPDASSSHMTRVAAIAAGRSGSAPRGVAPGATVVQASIDMPAYDNDETAARVAKAIECAITQGDVDVINLSLSEPRRQGYLVAFLDHLVGTYGVFVAVASGNRVYGTCPDGRPVSPATAWNVLTVGGTSDAGTSAWGDDRLWSEHGRDAVCTRDLPGQKGDTDLRIKPEISAPARNIGVPGFPLSSGTSYATPMVSGAAATLIARDGSLAARPHVVKAILVASSRVHRTKAPGGGISTDREGAGTLDVDWANAIVSGHHGATVDAGGYGERVLASTTDGDGCHHGDDATFTIPGHAGRTMRVTITWNSHAAAPKLGGSTSDRRRSDLDLVLRDPDGNVVKGARTSRHHLDASNLEWIDLVAPSTGSYTATIKVQRWDCGLATEPAGFAWIAF